MVLDPAWISVGLRTITLVQSSLHSNPHQLDEHFQQVTSQLSTIDSKLDEQVLQNLRSAVRFLTTALNMSEGPLKREQLMMARSRFVDLVSLTPEGDTVGTSGSFKNSYLRCLGYWGNYYYFVLSNDKKLALTEVYECGYAHPITCLEIFEPAFFPSTLVDSHQKVLHKGLKVADTKMEILQQLQVTQGDLDSHLSKELLYLLGGGAAGFTVGTLGNLILPGYAAAIGVRIMTGARDSFEGEAYSLQERITKLQEKLKQNEAAYLEEEQPVAEAIRTLCQERLSDIKRVTPAGLSRALEAAQ